MATSQPTDEKPSPHSNRPDYIHIGIDSTGAIHCWHASTNTVHVIYNGRRRQRIRIDAVRDFFDIDHYVTVIGDRRDWQDLAFGFDAYVGQLAEAV